MYKHIILPPNYPELISQSVLFLSSPRRRSNGKSHSDWLLHSDWLHTVHLISFLRGFLYSDRIPSFWSAAYILIGFLRSDWLPSF